MTNPWKDGSAAPSFNPVLYVPAGHKQAILDYSVQRIIVVGHAKIANETSFTNHWCLYLQVAEDRSIQIDCQPSVSVLSTVLTHGSKANIVISELSCVLPEDALQSKNLSVQNGLTVGTVIDLIIDSGNHKYEFNAQGTGCRMWVTEQVNLFRQKGFAVQNNDCEAAEEAVQKLWPDGTPLNLDEGAYYV